MNIKSVASVALGERRSRGACRVLRCRRAYLLFVGLAQHTLTRSIGLARESTAGWTACGNAPATPNGAPWGAGSSIDPSPLIVGNRLYLYYGATRTAELAQPGWLYRDFEYFPRISHMIDEAIYYNKSVKHTVADS